MANTGTGNPNNGIVYLTMKGTDASGNPITVQGSGVLLSDDEVLTAAHLVYNDDGTLRTTGSASVGYNAGSSIATSKVDATQALAKQVYTSLAGMSNDFAVVHLSTPVSGGTIFSLGSDLAAGTFTVSGYPAGTSGSLDTRTEALSVASGTNVYTGSTLDDGSGNPAGSSGGAIYQIVNGAPTVYGVISAESSSDQTKGYFKELTAADVTQIKAWVATADQSGAAAGAAVSYSAPGFSQALADQLASDASGYSGSRQAVMTDVATAISTACSQGGTFAQMTQEATVYLENNSSYLNKALAYLAGFLSGTTNSWSSNLSNTTNDIIAGSIVNSTTRSAASAGRNEGFAAVSAAPTAAILPGLTTLSNVISDNGSMAATSQTSTLTVAGLPSSIYAGSASTAQHQIGLSSGVFSGH